MSTKVLSVRVRKELKEEAEKLGVDFREVIEKALEEAIEREKRKRLEKAIEGIVELMKDVKKEEWIKVIREWRGRSNNRCVCPIPSP